MDQTAPPATETQQQNGHPTRPDGAAAAAAASNVPAPDHRGAANGEYRESPAWEYTSYESEPDSSRAKWLGALGGLVLLIGGIGGLIFMRRRHQASRRQQAMQVARDSAKSAVAAAGSVRGLSGLRHRLSRFTSRRPDVNVSRKELEQRAHAARKRIGR